MTTEELAPPPFGPRPILTEDTTPFWTAGENGRLLITRCQSCGHYMHPPSPICSQCLSMNMKPEAVSGRAKLASYTVNYQKWTPTMQVPFIVGIAELIEQTGLRLTTNIVDTPLDRVKIGMPLKVQFARHVDVWLPFFAEDLGQ